MATIGASAFPQGQQYVPDNQPGTGTCDNTPFNSGDMRFMFIMPTAQVHPSPGTPIEILDLAFAPCMSGTFRALQCEIRMAETSLSRITTCYDRNWLVPHVVYRGPLMWNATANQWSPIGLQFPFLTRGWDNILVEIRYKGGSGAMSLHSTNAMQRIYDRTSADPYNAVCASVGPEGAGPKTRITYDTSNRFRLVMPRHAHIGLFERIELTNGAAGEGYQIVASLGQDTVFIGGHRMNLAFDTMAFYSIMFGGPLFNNYAGVLDPFGEATGYLFVPREQSLLGMRLYHAAITYGRKITAVSGTVGIDLIP